MADGGISIIGESLFGEAQIAMRIPMPLISWKEKTLDRHE
jgi:hypothetical protein